MDELVYDGATVAWTGKGSYKAISGMVGFQMAEFQCVKDRGPVLNGSYYVPFIDSVTI